MKADLVYMYGTSSGEFVPLTSDNIDTIDQYTSQFEDIDEFINECKFTEKIGIFLYDNENVIEEDKELEVAIKYSLKEDDINILKFFIEKIENTKEIYLPAIFKNNIRNEKEIEEFIKNYAFPYSIIFLNKTKNIEKRYLYLRIYEKYLLQKISNKKPKKVI